MSITKQYREKLDSLIQSAKSIKNSPETTFAWRSLQLAKAWLGKSLSYLGSPSPYPPAETIDAIPPTADVSTDPPTTGTDHLANVNDMCGSIQYQIDAIEANKPTEKRQRTCWDNCLLHLTEAKFWYGFELAEMREKALAVSLPDVNTLTSNAKRIDQEWKAEMPATGFAQFVGHTGTDGIGKLPLVPAPEPLLSVEKPTIGFGKLDGMTPAPDPLGQKISENENKGRQKKSPDTPFKKG